MALGIVDMTPMGFGIGNLGGIGLIDICSKTIIGWYQNFKNFKDISR